MIPSKAMTSISVEDLTALVAGKVMATKTSILPFADFTIFMEELLRTFYKPGSRLVAGGHVTPEMELVANHAEIELVETLGTSPFSSDPESVLAAVSSPQDLIYVANPNRVTGTGFSLFDLEILAQAIPQGTMFIDEYYFDYYGITGLPLLDILTNVIIIRSFTASFAISSSDAGFVLANPEVINIIKDSIPGKPLSSTVRKTMFATLVNDEELSSRLRQIHEESLRLIVSLNRLKVQCRIAATDFLLLRVADTKSVGNFLARYRTQVDNLDGYPQLENYLRYQIQPAGQNDRLVEAFKKMPPDFYLMKSTDRRPTTIRRPPVDSREKNSKQENTRGLAPDSFMRCKRESSGKRKMGVRKKQTV